MKKSPSWLCVLGLVAALAVVARGGSCSSTSPLENGDVVTDGAGDYEANADCEWEFADGNPGVGDYYGLTFTQMDVNEDDKFCLKVRSAGNTDVCYVFPKDVGRTINDGKAYNSSFTLCTNPGNGDGIKFTSNGSGQRSGFSATFSNNVDKEDCDNPALAGAFVEGTDPYAFDFETDGGGFLGFLLLGGLTEMLLCGCCVVCCGGGAVLGVMFLRRRGVFTAMQSGIVGSSSPSSGYTSGPTKSNPYSSTTGSASAAGAASGGDSGAAGAAGTPVYESNSGGTGDIMVRQPSASVTSAKKRRSKGSKGSRGSRTRKRSKGSKSSRGSKGSMGTGPTE